MEFPALVSPSSPCKGIGDSAAVVALSPVAGGGATGGEAGAKC